MLTLTAYNNERFQWSQNLTAWAGFYDLSLATFRMQIRPDPDNANVLLEFATGGTDAVIIYDNTSHIMVATAPVAKVQNLKLSYAFDFGFTMPGGEFERIDGGTIEFKQGVTR